MKFIGQILPIEGYYVLLKENPPTDYAKSLTHLYQPLIGMQAVILYQTLLHEVELQNESTLQTHHTLMNYLNVPLDEIYQARLKLEGIGLLKTYENNSTENKFYTYELQRPFSPKKFFKDAMLTELLYHHIGKSKYETLKAHFQKQPPEQRGNDITISFSEVFQTFEPTFDHVEPVVNHQDEGKVIVNSIDFSWMEMMLKQRMIPSNKILTAGNKKLISEMTFLYDLATHEIEKSVLWALTEENKLDVDEFKVACHDLFKTKHNHTPIKLAAKEQVKVKRAVDNKPKTKEEQLIHRFETISPKQLLEDLSSGNQASEREMRIISEVMTSQGLPAPVMNVLVHYVLIQSNMKLSKPYLETIASHWSRANLKTAKDAMEFAKKEIEKFQKGPTRQSYRKQVSNEVVPQWFKERKEKQEKASKQNEKEKTEEVDEEKEKEEILALLQRHSNSNQNNHSQG